MSGYHTYKKSVSIMEWPFDIYSNINGLNLFSKLKVFKEVLQIEENTLSNLFNYIKKEIAKLFSKCMYYLKNF